MNNTEKIVIAAVLMVFVMGIIFSIKDVRVDAIQKENYEDYVSKTEAIKNSVIDLNKASSMELQFLKGIGPSKADAIVDYRQQHGPFQVVEEVQNVPGIGEKTFEGIVDRLEVSSEGISEISAVPEKESRESRIAINHASVSELEKLPGIGAVKAKAIIDHRETKGLFREYDDLLAVSGIGEKTLEKIRPYIIFGNRNIILGGL